MKKYLIALLTVVVLNSCKKENKEEQLQKGEEKKEIFSQSSTLKPEDSTQTQGNVLNDADNPVTPLADSGNDNLPMVIAKKGIQADANGSYNFSYNLKVGQVYPMKLSTQAKSTGTDGKQTIKESSKSTQNRVFKVKEITGSNYIIEVIEKSRSESVSLGNGESVSYNTAGAKPKNKDLALNYELARIEENHPLTIEMTPTGKVLSVNGLEPIRQKVIAKMEPNFKKMLAQVPEGENRPSDAEALKNFKESIKAKYSERAKIAELEQNLAGIYPNKPLKVGEKWSDSDSKSEGGNSLSYSHNYQLESVDNNKVTITSTGSVKSKTNQSQNGISKFSNGTQTSNGKVVFNQNSGWVEKVSITTKDVTKETLQAQGQKQNRTITTTTTTTVN